MMVTLQIVVRAGTRRRLRKVARLLQWPRGLGASFPLSRPVKGQQHKSQPLHVKHSYLSLQTSCALRLMPSLKVRRCQCLPDPALLVPPHFEGVGLHY